MYFKQMNVSSFTYVILFIICFYVPTVHYTILLKMEGHYVFA